MTTTQQVLTQAIVSAMTVSIMATAMGVMMGAMGASAFEAKPSELKGTQAAIRDLRLAFGSNIVDQAVKNVGTESVLALAQEVERLVIEDMYQKYGKQATDAALKAAVPGDVMSAREIAATLAGRGYGRAAPPREIPAPVMENVKEVAKKRVKQKAKPVKDLHTNVVYRSKAAAGMAVAAEYGLDPTNTFIWYEVIKKDPNRFVEVTGYVPPGAISPAAAYPLPKPVTAYPPPKALSPAEEAPPGFRTVTVFPRKEEAAGPSMTWTTESKQAMVNRTLPEWKQVLDDMSSGGRSLKPKKFIEKLRVIPTPAGFNPSAQGDFAFTGSYAWDGKALARGPMYTYDTMMTTIESPYERTVDVPRGIRVWVCTYDGQWGGFWARVNVYVHPDDLAEGPGLRLLHEGEMHGGT